jgi:hypothetical protein
MQASKGTRFVRLRSDLCIGPIEQPHGCARRTSHPTLTLYPPPPPGVNHFSSAGLMPDVPSASLLGELAARSR